MTRGDESSDVRDTPVRIDTTRASVTRVYDALLGGKDNFQADRDVRARFLELDPDFTRAVLDRREFMMRVTRYLAGEVGIAQFLDLGATLPEAENTHEIAQRLNRESAMVYVSLDHGVLAHGRALLADNDRTHMVEADFRKPRQVIEHPTVAKHLDFGQPMAVFHVGTMQHVRPERDPAGIIAAYIDALAPGSYLVYGHLLDPGPDHELAELAKGVRDVYLEAGVGLWVRTRAEIEGHLSGLDLLPPGLVRLADWWPDGPRLHPLGPTQQIALGAVGRKP
ncbi:SAM-dependent methyltransferase [Kibdelosporangium persicum]|uniref:O-Methyltransferase involved in polyketide biosynthesis n=1 Tax=Kibdelosporangium persicum TaxID=2698649 RepID=A0ABX2FA09_9PSEU|nr:SAM-dependent methyltransferase [Kibdelosporangium persicum]NRN67605.1 O-Methyltransferase involved in polyketide biosynthesis [Kibdelosporangium persicum]